jgi:integrase
MFREAKTSKRRELRLRSDNPTADIKPPELGTRKLKAFLYPSEVSALLECERIPLHYRHAIATSVYAYLRAGELEALAPGDVDLEHGVLTIQRARQADKSIGTGKNSRARQVPTEPTIALPLEALVKAGPSGVVLPGMGRGLLRFGAPSRSRRSASRFPLAHRPHSDDPVDHVARPPRDGPHVVRGSRRRPAQDSAARRTPKLRDHAAVHPHG